MVAPAPVLPWQVPAWTRATRRSRSPTGAGVADVRIVVARFPFTPSGWSSVPSGPCMDRRAVRCSGPSRCTRSGSSTAPTRSCGGRSHGSDVRTGGMRASEVRDLTVVPRFANRVGADGAMRPSATGRLPSAPRRPPEGPARDRAGRGVLAQCRAALLPCCPMRRSCRIALRRVARMRGCLPGSVRGRLAGCRSRAYRRRGGEIVSPISGGSYLVRMRPDALARLRNGRRSALDRDLRACLQVEPDLDLSATWTDRRDGAAVHGW